MRIHFDPYFTLFTDGVTELEINKATVGDCIAEVFDRYPRLLTHLMVNKAAEADKTTVRLNADYLWEPEHQEIQVRPDDSLYLGRDIPEGASSATKLIAGVVLIAAGAYFENSNMMLMGASMVFGALSSMATPTLTPFVSATSDNPDSVYSFNGIQNTTASGTPVAIIYGEHRVGGQVINAYVQTVGSVDYLKVQLALCEGEVDNIDPTSIKMNGLVISDLSSSQGTSVAISTRNGTFDQKAEGQSTQTSGSVKTTVRPPAKAPNTDGYDEWGDGSHTWTSPVGQFGYDPTWQYDWCGLTAFGSFDEYHTFILPPTKTATVTYRYNTFEKSVSKAKTDQQILAYRKAGTTDDFQVVSFQISMPNANGEATYAATFPEYAAWEVRYVCRYYKQGNGSGYWGSSHFPLSFTVVTAQEVGAATPIMAEFSNVKNVYAYNQEVYHPADSDPTKALIIPTKAKVSAVDIILSAPSFWKANATQSTYVDISISYRKVNDDLSKGDWVPAFVYRFTSAVSKSEVVLTANQHNDGSPTIVFPEDAMYELQLVRVQGSNNSDITVSDTVYVKEINEIIYAGLLYPHTALVGISINATGQINGSLPTITSVVRGMKVRVPLGYNGSSRQQETMIDWNYTFKPATEYTNNPVWCLYDLITNKRYGLGNYFKIDPAKEPQILANFYAIAAYCDEIVDDTGAVLDPLSVEARTTGRKRFSLNIVIDSTKAASEWITAICSTFRAVLYYSEGIVWLDVDRVKSVAQIFNKTTITDYSQVHSSFKAITNLYEVQFLNASNDWEHDTILLESQDLKDDPTQEEQKRSLSLVGVTDEKQAKSLAKYMLEVGRRCLTSITFKTGTQGLGASVGSVIGIQHDVPLWSFGGRISSITPGSPTLLNLSETFPYCSTPVDGYLTGELEVSISKDGGTPVVLTIVNLNQSGTPEDCSSIYVNPAYTTDDQAVHTFDFSDDGLPHTWAYSIGPKGSSIRLFRIMSLKRSAQEMVEVSAIEYFPDLYATADDITDTVQAHTDQPFTALPSVLSKRSVSGFNGNVTVYADSAGVIKTGVDLWYSVPTPAYVWSGVQVAYGMDGDYTYTEMDSSGHIRIPDIPVSGDYQFVALSVFKDGTRQTIEQALADSNVPFFNLHIDHYVPNDISDVGVTGLEVIGSLDGSFYGKDCAVQWRTPILADPFLNSTAGDEAAGSNRTDTLLLEYRVEVRNTDGSLRRMTRVPTTTFTYTHEMNHEDGKPTRKFDIVVTAIDKVGRLSKSVSLRVANPAPAALA